MVPLEVPCTFDLQSVELVWLCEVVLAFAAVWGTIQVLGPPVHRGLVFGEPCSGAAVRMRCPVGGLDRHALQTVRLLTNTEILIRNVPSI